MLLSLYKFWSPMFKYVKGVFLRANNMYHQSLKCPLNNYILILVSRYLFNRFLNTTTMALN